MIVTRSPAPIRRDRPGPIRSVGASRFGRALARPLPVEAAERDPYFNSVVLLLHMDGENGSTAFTDEKGHTVAANGGVQISTAQYKFGGASGSFSAAGDLLSIADSDEWTFDGDFTVEAWIRPANVTSLAQYIFSHLFDGGNLWGLRLDFAGGTGLGFLVLSGGAVIINASQGATTGWTANTWYHVAATRSGNDFRVFRDGTVLGSSTDADAIPNFAGLLRIGDFSGAGTEQFTGYMDDVRITKGVARYTSDFVPPKKPFPDK